MIFYKQELRDLRENVDPKTLKPKNAIKALIDAGIDLDTLPSWPELKIIESVANTIKHGDGTSAENLRKIRPELFIDPSIPSDLSFGPSNNIDKPLQGDGIYITTQQLQEFSGIIKSFWDELFELLKHKTA